MRFSAILLPLTIGLAGLSTLSSAADNLRFKGALVAEPCTLRADDENIDIDFESIVDKYLYIYGRTLGKPLVLHLDDCDISLGNLVKVSFAGPENSALSGLLAVTGTSGVAIGIETTHGARVVLNSASYNQGLVSGNNTINLRTYVQGEPEALAQKKIAYGHFAASATFLLEYE